MKIDEQNKYPVTEGCMPYEPDNPQCKPDCDSTDPDLKLGQFRYSQLNNIVDVQNWIRTWGSVVTGIQIMTDLREFFEKQPNAVYTKPGECLISLQGAFVPLMFRLRTMLQWLFVLMPTWLGCI